jgi:hypothetical protein
MDTLTSNSKGHIHPIINQEWDTIALGDLMQLFGCGDQISGIALFVPVLHDRDTWSFWSDRHFPSEYLCLTSF